MITIIGKRGSGKTTLSRTLQSAYPRIVVFDRLQEYDRSKFDGAARNFYQFAEELRRLSSFPKFRLLFQFDIEGGAHDEEFSEALRVLYKLGGVCIVVEEVWNFANKNYLPHWLREILLTGRHGQNKILRQGIALITTSQRPAEIHKTLLSQSSHIFSGILFETNDLNYLKEFVGASVCEQLRRVPPYHFLHFRPGQPVQFVPNK